MQIADNAVVTLHYKLHLGDGVTIDQSDPNDPLVYLHGNGDIVPGLEAALVGLSKGARKDVVVGPDEGYGERDPDGVEVLPMSEFEDQPVEAGDEFWAEDEDGDEISVTIVKVEGDQVTVDYNHPLAGKTLHFSVDVLDVREATAEELEHGHPHGADGHEVH